MKIIKILRRYLIININISKSFDLAHNFIKMNSSDKKRAESHSPKHRDISDNSDRDHDKLSHDDLSPGR